MNYVTQHQDRNVKRKEYEQFGTDKLLVTSLFRTIQGEGPFAGRCAVFVRLSGCNYGSKSPDGPCRFCDSFFDFDKGTLSTLDELATLVDALAQPNDILVITGGEPTLQHNLIEFFDVVIKKTKFFEIQVETNGSQSSFFEAYSKRLTEDAYLNTLGGYHFPYYVTFVVSPKAPYKAMKYGPLSQSVLNHTNCLKFVVEDRTDSPHYTVPDWAFEARVSHGFRIYVSPMAEYNKAYDGEVSSIWDEGLINREKTAKNYAYAAEYALKHNLMLSVQTHLFTAIP